MDNDEKLARNMKHNAPFLKAFNFVAELKANGKQGDFAKMIGTNSSLISAYRKGEKRVSPTMMDRLIAASDGRVSKYYLLGLSKYMLLENMPDDEYLEINAKAENPDFELMKSRHQPDADVPDTSSTVNAALASRDMLIEELRDKISEKDDTIEFLKQQIEQKDKLIAELVAKSGQSLAQKYPFGIGSAETLEFNK